MKIINIYIIGVLTLFISCKDKHKSISEENPKIEAPKTYAEISIKEGGQWDGRKYVGDNITFKNVDYLKAPDSLTDHSYYIRYEGPGWESNKVGYRLYFDWRNAIDIFGKKVDTMVLSKVGVNNYDSYHEDSPWGQDILKAGESLGIGSYGRFDGDQNVTHFQEVDSTTAQIHNSTKESGVTLNYYGWSALDSTIDLQTQLTIAPDSRITKTRLTPSKAIEGLVTGIVKFEDIELIKNENTDAPWGYIATYGEQTLVPDQFRYGNFFRKEQVKKITDSEFDHLIVFKPTTEPITYYFTAAWEKEKNGIKNRTDFISYLNNELSLLNK